MNTKNIIRLAKNAKLTLRKPRLVARILFNYWNMFALNKRLPRSIELAVTYECQCSCDHCSAEQLKTQSDTRLTPDEMIASVNEYINAGAVHLHLTGGDPLLWKPLFSFLKAVKTHRVYVSLVTNGLLLNSSMVTKLRKSGVDMVQVSLDSVSPEQHDSFRGVKGCYDRAVKGIKLAKKMGQDVGVNLVLTREKVATGEIWEQVKQVEELGAQVFLIIPAPCGMWKDNFDVMLQTQEELKTLKKLEKHPGVYRDLHFAYRKYRCPAGTERVHVTVDGEVYACPFLQHSFGNIRQENILNIWDKMCNVPYFQEDHDFCPAGEDQPFMRNIATYLSSKDTTKKKK